jgi:putative ABC transport system substrate-binding protein
MAGAQQATMPVIGVLTWAEATFNTAMIVEFRQGLAKVGYIEGQNVAIEYRWADTQIARLPALAADLVHRQVAVIIAGGILNPILAAKRATSTIPIVFAYGGDPVKDGLVTSLNRPGGNVTGMAAISSELVGKKLSLVGDLVPPAATVAFLAGLPGDSSYSSYFEDQKTQILAAARALGRKVMILETRSDRNYEAAFKTLVQGRAGALIVGSYAFRNNEIVALAARYKIPTIYNDRGGSGQAA